MYTLTNLKIAVEIIGGKSYNIRCYVISELYKKKGVMIWQSNKNKS